jgi:division protein CdvB (Snf7/Vps24/ESCRT-III family)
MKKAAIVFSLLLALFCAPTRSDAQITEIIGLVGSAVKKVITALDLEVQQLQEQTLELQEAQKQLENAMSLSELNGITSWVKQQYNLYSGYFNELWQIKNAIDTYQRVKDLIEKEGQTVSQYQQIKTAIGQDKHFSAAEVTQMNTGLSGIVTESANNLTQITKVITAFVTQMEDAERLRIIDEAGTRIDKNYTDLQDFSQRAVLLSLQRSKDAGDVGTVKALYGIQ